MRELLDLDYELTELTKQQIIGSIPESKLVLFCPGLQGRGSTLIDRSQYTNHGQITGSPWTGLRSGARALTLSTTYQVLVPHSASLNPTTKLTLLVWLKLLTTPSDWYFTFNKDGNAGYYLRIGADRTLAFVPDHSQWTTALSPETGPLALNTPYFVGGVKDENYIRLYLQGVSDGTPIAKTGTFIMGTGNLYFGTDTASVIHFFICQINDALSAGQILSIYNRTKQFI